MSEEPTEVELLYDRECPICEYYCQRVDIDSDIGELVRVDAREDSRLLDEVTSVGLDIDEGMVLRVGDAMYYGSDAINELALFYCVLKVYRQRFLRRITVNQRDLLVANFVRVTLTH